MSSSLGRRHAYKQVSTQYGIAPRSIFARQRNAFVAVHYMNGIKRPFVQSRCLTLCVLLFCAACSKPYRPPTIVHGSAEFPGIGGVMESEKAVDVVLIHGMCTHNEAMAHIAMDRIVHALAGNIVAPQSRVARNRTPTRSNVQIITRSDSVAGGTVNFSAILWSPLTEPLKRQLVFDNTETPNNCETAEMQSCKPVRARLNGMLKDRLLNDCLSDALIYQGQSRRTIMHAMVQALSQIGSAQGDSMRPLVLVSASLGSKIVFDALSSMLKADEGTPARMAARRISDRLVLIFMEANQMPILGLADQDVGSLIANRAQGQDYGGPKNVSKTKDSLQSFLQQRTLTVSERSFNRLKIVAFTDPNDLLSYRLLGSQYTSYENISIADVLVSNDSTYFGLFENPVSAHTMYSENADVARLIACGHPKASLCR